MQAVGDVGVCGKESRVNLALFTNALPTWACVTLSTDPTCSSKTQVGLYVTIIALHLLCKYVFAYEF